MSQTAPSGISGDLTDVINFTKHGVLLGGYQISLDSRDRNGVFIEVNAHEISFRGEEIPKLGQDSFSGLF